MKIIEPEVVFSHEAGVGTYARATKAGTMRQLGPRLFTANLRDDLTVICRRNIWRILTGYFPDALLSDRTALELEPAPDGSVFFISGRITKMDLPGLQLRPRYGAGPPPPAITRSEPVFKPRRWLGLAWKTCVIRGNARPNDAR